MSFWELEIQLSGRTFAWYVQGPVHLLGCKKKKRKMCACPSFYYHSVYFSPSFYYVFSLFHKWRQLLLPTGFVFSVCYWAFAIHRVNHILYQKAYLAHSACRLMQTATILSIFQVHSEIWVIWNPLTILDVLVRGFYCCDKTSGPNLGRNGFISSYKSQSTFHHWGKSGQETEGRSWCRQRHGGVLLTGVPLMTCSVCFFIEPRTSSPGKAPHTMGWAFPHDH